MAGVGTEPQTLIVDIEISKDIITTYGLREQYHSPDNILQDWFMICFAWKWLGGEEPHAYSVMSDRARFKDNPTDDYAVVLKLHSIIKGADIIVGHNVGRFDWKKFMSKVIKYKLPPIPKPLIVDTLTVAKNLAYFTSNKLSYLSEYLEIEHKMKHSNDMWLRILKGDKAAIKECVEYCKGDIRTTEEMYLRLRPYMESHPNMNLWGHGEKCNKCASSNLVKHKTRRTRTGVYQQYQCNDCGGYSQGVKRIKGATIK